MANARLVVLSMDLMVGAAARDTGGVGRDRTEPWVRYIAEESAGTLDAYAAQPNLVAEHVSIEQDIAAGGYQHRQLFELVQNGADALWPAGNAEMRDDRPSSPEVGASRFG